MEKLVVSANQARQMLATSPNTMSTLLKTGEIKAYKDGRQWKIPVEELKRYVREKADVEAERRRKSG